MQLCFAGLALKCAHTWNKCQLSALGNQLARSDTQPSNKMHLKCNWVAGLLYTCYQILVYDHCIQKFKSIYCMLCERAPYLLTDMHQVYVQQEQILLPCLQKTTKSFKQVSVGQSTGATNCWPARWNSCLLKAHFETIPDVIQESRWMYQN